MYNNLYGEVQRFWSWFNENSKQKNIDIDVTLYPQFESLITITKKSIQIFNEFYNNIELAELIIIVMELDNESERIMEYILDYCNTEAIHTITKVCLISNYSNAKWQIAELLGRTNHKSYIPYVEELLHDANPYVRRRALLSLCNLDETRAIKVSFNQLLSRDEMMRLVALRIIKENIPQVFCYARKILSEEDSARIVNELNN